MVRKYLKRAEINNGTVNSLRHTFGTHHAAKGTSGKTLQKVLGFKDKRSLSKYFSLANDDNRGDTKKTL